MSFTINPCPRTSSLAETGVYGSIKYKQVQTQKDA